MVWKPDLIFTVNRIKREDKPYSIHLLNYKILLRATFRNYSFVKALTFL